MERSRRATRTLIGVAFVLGCVLFDVTGASAQGSPGVRAGVSVDPDQFYFGGHVEAGPLVEDVWFRPNIEIGIGDNLTLISLNFELVYWVPAGSRSQDWRLYLGGGPAINIFSFDERRRGRDDTEAEPGFNIVIGVAARQGLFGEFKVGALDSPDLKFAIGYAF